MVARTKLRTCRTSRTTAFRVDDLKGYMTVGLYDDGMPGEVFLKASKPGSTVQGLLDGVAIMVSHALQYGVPLNEIVTAFKGMAFPPQGMTNDPDIPNASSILDYVARKLEMDYL